MAISIYQFTTAIPSNMNFLADAVSPSPTKGFALMPSWSREPMKHEVDRAVRITNDK